MFKVFCKEFAKERNRLASKANQGRESLEKELATVLLDYGKLLYAVIFGIPADQVKDKMQVLSKQRKALKAQLSRVLVADSIQFHPRMPSTPPVSA